MCRSSLKLVMVRWFLAELCPFHFEKKRKFSFSVHFLPNGVHIQLKFNIWICYMSIQWSREYNLFKIVKFDISLTLTYELDTWQLCATDHLHVLNIYAKLFLKRIGRLLTGHNHQCTCITLTFEVGNQFLRSAHHHFVQLIYT
jgi:hypothetical protein